MDILDTFLDSQPPEPTPADRFWSPLQLAVFDEMKKCEGNVLIEAVAGGAKSTTLVESTKYTFGSNLMLAFNKAIAEELRPKVGSNGDVKTLNALGHGLLWRNRRSAELDARKVSTIIKRIMGEGSPDHREYGYQLSRVVGLMKNCAFGLASPYEVEDVVRLIDSYQMDIPFDRLHQMASIASSAFNTSNKDQSTFDFDDQLYIPLLEGWDYPSYANVFIDEAQDLSPIQHLMLQRMGKMGSRMIAVGDRYQAIYGFRGALTNSMDLLKERFEMKELPLSISYRCPISVVEEARVYCPHIEARPNALLGLVENAEDGDGEPELFSNALIICRNNAPLFRAILRHVRAKSPCRVLTNFLESFQSFIRGFKCTSTLELQVKLDYWFEREKEAAEKKGFRGKIAMLRDKYETTMLLAEEFSKVDDMLNCVRKLGEGTSGPTFATIHKAKGLEHENVYILRPDLMPSPFATTPDAKQQEANLTYVAITRAKSKLTWGVSPKGY